MTVISSKWWDRAFAKIGEPRHYHESELDPVTAKHRMLKALAKAECEKARAEIRARNQPQKG